MTRAFEWSDQHEKLVLFLREQSNFSFRAIAEEIGITEASAKHKYRRLTQSRGDDRYHHPQEKTEQIHSILPKQHLTTLELNAGWGNLTRVYQTYGTVLAYDIDVARVQHVKDLQMEDVDIHQGDSFRELHGLIYNRLWFDVVDLDPYGMPSRFFPHVFELLRDGWLFITFPKIGVQKINKITIEHLRVFWGIDLTDKDDLNTIIHTKIKDLAMQSYRSVDVLDELDLGRMMRFAYKVQRRSALEMVDLTVNRDVKPLTKLAIPNLFNYGDS